MKLFAYPGASVAALIFPMASSHEHQAKVSSKPQERIRLEQAGLELVLQPTTSWPARIPASPIANGNFSRRFATNLN